MAEQECFPCGEDISLEDRIRQSFKCDGSGGTFIQGSKLNLFDKLAPSGLSLTVISETSIKLDWTNNSTNADGVSIERSTNGTDYSQLATVSASTATYTDTTGSDGTRYYYRLKSYKEIIYSVASTAANDYTAIKMVLTSTGTGAGVSTVKFWFDTTNVVATLDGNGKWYSDSGGTADQSASYTFTYGSLQTRYLKVTSGSSNLLVFAKGNWKGFGSNTVNGFASSTNAPSISFTLSKLKTQTYFYCGGSNTVSGALSGLPSGLTYFYCGGSNTISGALSDLPSGVTYFLCGGSNTVSGALSDLPSGVTYFYCGGSNTISGALSDLPSGVTYFLCGGSNTVSGALSDLPSELTYFYCSGSNTISDYTSGHNFANLMNYFYHVPVSGGGLSSTEIDNLIIDLDSGNTWGGSSRTLYLKGTNAARTSASDAAVASLVTKSVTVITN